jgi:FkbM family methyltransferase
MSNTVEILAWIGSRIGKPPGWERVVRMFASPKKCREMREICVVRDGVIFLANPAVPIGWHIMFFGSYEPEVREIFRAVLPIGGVALDIGANVGWHTLLMARLVGRDGRVLAVEPNPSVRERLQAHLILNRFPQVEVIPFALADTEGTVAFFGPDANDVASGDGHVVTEVAAEQRDFFQVETRRLDFVFRESMAKRLDLIKIDVEGFEWPVFQGGEQIIEEFRPHIVFEFNSEYSVRGGGSPEVLEEFFKRHGYRLFEIGRSWAEELEPQSWPTCADIWAVPTT